MPTVSAAMSISRYPFGNRTIFRQPKFRIVPLKTQVGPRTFTLPTGKQIGVTQYFDGGKAAEVCDAERQCFGK
jgi:hypothetical protein